MFKSLRWRLQVWHALVLLTVLTSFGGLVHSLHWQTRLQQVDAELDRTNGLVISQLRRLLPRPPGFRPGRRQRRPDDAVAEADAAVRQDGGARPELGARPDANIVGAMPRPESRQEQRPEPRQEQRPEPRPEPRREPGGPENPPAEGMPRRDRAFPDPGPLPDEFQQLFQGNEDSRLYFVIWGGNGDLLQKSESAPDISYPNLHVGADGLPFDIARSRKEGPIYRELIHAGMFDMNILVGKSLEKDLAAHHRSGIWLITSGLVILAAGVLGGGWLSARAIRPIADMTATAESISEQNLSERIDVKETDSELGQLATVLNGTFDRLQAAFERQSQFTADASHELRTPLSVIATHTELALSRPRSSEDYRATIETCSRAAQRMKSLMEALLLLARFESGTPSIKHDRIELKPFLMDCVNLVESLGASRNIDIDCQAGEGHIRGDWDRLSQVFTNLLTNSIRYNVDGGHVKVKTRIEGDQAVVSVIDTGVGIAEDQLPHIFDRFYQVDKVRSRAEGSCGLGLSICKTIVEAHGGSITAKSALNVGTTIEVRLSVAPDTPSGGKKVDLGKRELATVAAGEVTDDFNV